MITAISLLLIGVFVANAILAGYFFTQPRATLEFSVSVGVIVLTVFVVLGLTTKVDIDKMITKEHRERIIQELVNEVEDWDYQTLLDWAQHERRLDLENLDDDELVKEYFEQKSDK